MLGHTTFGRTATATWQARAEKMRLELNQLEAVGGETNKRYQNEAFANLGSPFNEPVMLESDLKRREAEESREARRKKAQICVQALEDERKTWVEPKGMEDEVLLATIQNYVKKHSGKLLWNALRKFVTVSIFLVAINVHTATVAFNGSDRMNMEIKSRKCKGDFYLGKCKHTILCEEMYNIWRINNTATFHHMHNNNTEKLNEYFSKKTTSFLISAVSINAASIAIISSIVLLMWRDIRLVKHWGKYNGLSKRSFKQKWKFNEIQHITYNDPIITTKVRTRISYNRLIEGNDISCLCFSYKNATVRHVQVLRHSAFAVGLLFLLLCSIILSAGDVNVITMDLSIIYIIASYLFGNWSTGDFTVIQMSYMMVILPAYQFALAVISLNKGSNQLDVFSKSFECVIESKVSISQLYIDVFGIFATCCLLFLSARKATRKGELSILGKCTPPEYILKHLVEFSDFAESDPTKQMLHDAMSSPTGFKWMNIGKVFIPIEKKRNKEMQQDKILSEIKYRLSRGTSCAFPYSKSQKGISIDAVKAVSESIIFTREYFLSEFVCNRISKQCKERLESTTDCPLLEQEMLLITVRSIMLSVYFIMYSVVFYTTKGRSKEASNAKNIFVFFDNYLGLNFQEKLFNLLPVFVLYIDVLLRLIESLVLFILTKIRNYEITMQDEELAYRYVKYFRFVALGTFVTAIFLARFFPALQGWFFYAAAWGNVIVNYVGFFTYAMRDEQGKARRTKWRCCYFIGLLGILFVAPFALIYIHLSV